MSSTIFSGINVALQAVLAHQQAIEVIEHNVANASTPGYHRQQAILGANYSSAMPGLVRDTSAGVIGNGVIVKSIQRFADEFIDNRYRKEASASSQWDLESTVMQQIESVMAENGSDGVLPKLDRFWAAWQSLSADPTNTSLRADLVDKTNDLASAFNRRVQELQSLQADQTLAVRQRVQKVNDDAGQVATLNGQIARLISVGQQPNDLIDTRERLLDELAKLTGATVAYRDNGEVMVDVGGHALVSGHTQFLMTLDPNTGDVAWADDPDPTHYQISGELRGLLDLRDNVIPGIIARLDTTANTLIGRVNLAHSAGYGLDGASTNNAFFIGANALTIRINPNIAQNTDLIAAATQAGAPGDGNNALALGRIQELLVLTGMPPTQTINQYYNSAVTGFGLQTLNAKQNASDRKLVAEALDQQRSSVGGVSLDEEAAKLVLAQRSFEAASRMLTAFDEMMDKIINGMGIVGR
jgi:flagellar hook-associated protein 1 FlgK